MHIHYINRDTFLFPPPPKKNFLTNIKKKIVHLLRFRRLFYKKNFLANINKIYSLAALRDTFPSACFIVYALGHSFIKKNFSQL